MRLFIIALLAGISLGGYVVWEYGPPELKTGISNFFGKWQEAFPLQAQEEQLPADPVRRAEILINRLDSRLYELDRLAQIVETSKKESAKSANASQNKDSQEVIAPEDKIINELFKTVPSNPEEKIKIIVSATRKLVEDLRQTTNELKTSAAGGSGQVSGGAPEPSASQGQAVANQTQCACSQ